MAYDDEGMLQAIREHPDDDAPRMVYADWLGDNGDDDRANFIRFQCWAEDANKPPAERERFRASAAELLQRHCQEWERPLRDLGATEVTFRRGLPYYITIPAAMFLGNAEHIFALSPVRSVRIIRIVGNEQLRRLVGSEHLGNLTTLHLDSNDIGPEGAAALAGSPRLINLTTLDLRDNRIGPQGAVALAGSEHLTNLEVLDLGFNRIGDAGAAALAASRHVANLTTLEVEYNNIGPQGAAALIESPQLAHLTRLNLEGNFYIPHATLDSIAQVIAGRREQAK